MKRNEDKLKLIFCSFIGIIIGIIIFSYFNKDVLPILLGAFIQGDFLKEDFKGVQESFFAINGIIMGITALIVIIFGVTLGDKCKEENWGILECGLLIMAQILFITFILPLFIMIAVILMVVLYGIKLTNGIIIFLSKDIFLNILQIFIERASEFLGENLVIKSNSGEIFLFLQYIIYWCILPYAYLLVIKAIQKFLKVFGRSGYIFSNILKYITIDIVRYITYFYAFIIYILDFSVVKTNIIYINIIKESLLAFIIIDVVIYGGYSTYKQFKVNRIRKKNILNKGVFLKQLLWEIQTSKSLMLNYKLLGINSNITFKLHSIKRQRECEAQEISEKREILKQKRLKMKNLKPLNGNDIDEDIRWKKIIGNDEIVNSILNLINYNSSEYTQYQNGEYRQKILSQIDLIETYLIVRLYNIGKDKSFI